MRNHNLNPSKEMLSAGCDLVKEAGDIVKLGRNVGPDYEIVHIEGHTAWIRRLDTFAGECLVCIDRLRFVRRDRELELALSNWATLYGMTPPHWEHIHSQRRWDRDYVRLAKFWGELRSKDPSTKVGAVIARQDNTQVSLGYNGFPRGMRDNPCLYANRESKYARTIHAEVNAILNARESVQGHTLYIGGFGGPCAACALFVIQAGIRRIVHEKPSAEIAERWKDSIASASALLSEAGVRVTEIVL